MTSKTSSIDQFPGLDGIRGIACLMVFAYHARWQFRGFELALGPIDGYHWLSTLDSGVCIFFVLSGLLLSIPFWDAIDGERKWPSFGTYMARRIARIVPAYYAILVVLYLLSPGTYSVKGLTDFLLHASFLHTFIDFSYGSVNPVLWSIGIEFQFYLLLPLIMYGMRSLSRLGVNNGVVCGALLIATGVLGHYEQSLLANLKSPIPYGQLQTQGTILWYLQYFAAGITVGWLARQGKSWSTSERWALALGALGMALFVVHAYLGQEGDWRTQSTTGWPLNVLFISVWLWGVCQSSILSRWFASRVLAFVGLVSYGLYLWHWPVMVAVAEGRLDDKFSGLSRLIAGSGIALAVSMAFASLSYFVIEAPGRRKICDFAASLRNHEVVRRMGGQQVDLSARPEIVGTVSAAAVSIEGPQA